MSSDYITSSWLKSLETNHIFLHLSWVCLLNSVVSYVYSNDNSYLIALAVFSSTQLYWRDPANQWKRWTDIVCVSTGTVCQLWYGWGRPAFKTYTAFTLTAGLCYPVSHYYESRGDKWKGCYWHAGLHILANIGLFVLNITQ